MKEQELRHTSNQLIREAASFVYLLGGMAPKHLVIVGGLVAPLLVPDAFAEHRGSADIDFCLSVAFIAGSTAQYYKSLETLIEPYFELDGPSGFRWRKRDDAPGLRFRVDFLAPDDDTAPVADGTKHLDASAAANTGLHLRPFPIRAGHLVDEDAESMRLEAVELVYDPGVRADVSVRHAGPVGLLAAKADALAGRSEYADGYDVSWWCLHAGATADDVAELVITRAAFKNELFPESVAQLEAAFRAPDYPGPNGYARELLSGDYQTGDPEYEQARNEAYLRVSQVVERLKQNLW
jgi:hypothetical protein